VVPGVGFRGWGLAAQSANEIQGLPEGYFSFPDSGLNR
jgi:hypothetical protein